MNESVVTFAFKLTANTLPEAQSSVSVFEVIDGAVLVSFKPVYMPVVIVGLVAKGKGKKDLTGFVLQP